MTQIGIMIEGQNGLNWQNWQQILRTAEDSGYQCVFRSDHFTNPNGPHMDALELWTSLTYAASHTERIEFGPLVTPVTFRHPSMNVKYASAISDLSGGRLILGMGIGWQIREHESYGIDFPDVNERYERLEDALNMTKLLFESEEPIDYEGKHYHLKEAMLLPRPIQGGPPILIGGNGPKRTLPMAAKYADEWNAVFIDPETYKDRTERLNDLLEKEGRQPGDVKRSLMTRVFYGKDDAALQALIKNTGKTAEEIAASGLIVGTADAVVDQIGKWAELGIERFMLQWMEIDDMASLEDMAAKVLPTYHK
ncbi:TIGR03560 family F420-dependent LLM class oxidoreductase [Phototrophicus methaneseepsis]|uniref:TIGR03560 family F420-dependent LLM class oxidoreductase n=1 Tax=Phototrophicus methaneseepsis TaxID=2710758 RepID=A0A7S8E961_9CHLR|nr:TIGR03560 family F420-dependent LLM class oxidoreductase [Phototrophicus methaneseepsis]QPC82655.1 TIGR03560 family F420-dependent LLM class oxidoreductase [Phototrophicus methaneseepsis]